MAKRVQVKRSTATKWSAPLLPETAEQRIEAQLDKLGDNFRLRQARVDPYDPFGPWRKLFGTMKRVRSIIKNGDFGEYWVIDADGSDVNMEYRIIEIDVIPDSTGTDPIDIIRYHLFKNFPGLASYGICSCRRIAGYSNLWSQHAYCNAEDYGASFAYMQEAVTWLMKNIGGKGLDLPVAELIFNRKKWEPGTGNQYYGGVDPHTGHFHITGYPERSGTPACAS